MHRIWINLANLLKNYCYGFLKAVYYLMKVSFGLVIGAIIGLVIYLGIGKSVLGIIFLLVFTCIGLVAGIVYAENVRRSGDSPYFARNKL